MNYDTIKALHIIFVVTWFAGLFYIVRLFVYHQEAIEKDEPSSKILVEQYKIMEKRLWYGITWPSCILTVIFGGPLISQWLPLAEHPWLISKLILIFLLLAYHLICHKQFKGFQVDKSRLSSMQYRYWNEVATLFLVSIVFLVELKESLNALYAVVGFIIFSIALGLAIKAYRKIRNSK